MKTMKKRLYFRLANVIVFVSLLTTMIPMSLVRADTAVYFSDSNLEAVVREVIKKPSGVIYQSDFSSYVYLDASSRNISNLGGLEYWTNLEVLHATNNNISNIAPLANLQSLGDLNLEDNQVSDLSPLSSCRQLWFLDLESNQLSNITALQELNLLNIVDLENNHITDLGPLYNNPGMDSGDWLDVQVNPLDSVSINTYIPALIARGVNVEGGVSFGITGYVEDGYTHKLGGVAVTLLDVSFETQMTKGVTITNGDGEYSFSGIDAGNYQIKVALENHRTVGDTAVFSVNYDVTGPVVSAQTPSFTLTSGTFTRNISFADADLVPTVGIPQVRLDDLAGMYYHTMQVIDFEWVQLGFMPDLNLPIEVHGYVTDNASTTDEDESQTCYYEDGQVYLGTGDSDYDDDDRPVTREWHEMFHELMDDAVGIPPYHTGDENHDGFYNHCTVDSWVEGWAEFWSCALKRDFDTVDWPCFWDSVNLEFNWQVWDFDDEVSREEFAVASLLVDLIDPVDPLDMDYISLNIGELWAIIGSQPLANMHQVYIALTDANVGQTDTNANVKPDLDDLFIAHGFFADEGDPGNRQYDISEEVGYGGKTGRTNTLRVPNAYLRILVVDSNGNPIDSGTLVVDVIFNPPLDIYNRSYEVDLKSPDSLKYFEVAPDSYEPLIKMKVRDNEGNLSDEFILSNSEYWQKVGESATGYADKHTFVIGTGEKESAGVPAWGWLVVGMAVVIIGAAGFLRFFLLPRRKGKRTPDVI